jgi:hypothetical protein
MLKPASVALALTLLACTLGVGRTQPPAQPGSFAAQDLEFFETKIRPVLADHCFKCHGPDKQKAGLRLDSREALLKGNESGPAIVPGHPEKSLLLQVLSHKGETKMPPDGPLPRAAIADFETWVKLGAPWTPGKVAADIGAAWKKHWAFQPVKSPALPAVQHKELVKTPVDAFVLAELEKHGLTLSPAADRRTLLRRATFDLLGLPPTAAEIDAFEKDQSPNAWEKVVDRLLASPHYGERWGRHWLDVARYADTKGYVFTEERRFAYSYTYRDYVIKTFNDDLPFDRFVVEQLAADRLVAQGKGDSRALAAMGFLTLGRRFLNNQHDIIDDRIDVTTRGLLGLTVACARCHDHKYDPIPARDYYSLYGVFNSSAEPKELPLLGEPERTPEYVAFEQELQVRQKAVSDYAEKNKAELAANNRKFRDELKALQKKVDQWSATSPAAPPRAMVLVDLPKPREPRVLLRGNPNSPGPQVPRQFLHVLAGEQRQPFKDGSGRLELARAIAAPDNPLTARVLVNRVWLHHFGKGLVRTPSDFGLRSEPPTHPQLLDYLATRFMAEGWSIKKLHRLILLSSAYRQGSRAGADAQRIDPENRLISHMNRRRLDFEAMRDALLFVAGRLDLRMGGPPVEMFEGKSSNRRSVYGFIDRQNLPGLLRTFDFANPDTSNPQRYETTVPQQALFLMNSPFVIEQTRGLVQRGEVATAKDGEARVRALYRVVFGRQPDADELTLGVRFLQTADPAAGGAAALTPLERYAQVLVLTNEFVFVD